MFDSSYGVALAVVLALVPGLVRLARGPSLRRLADHPALPEHLMQFNRRVSILSAACLGGMAYGLRWWMVWVFPLSVLGQWLGGFPLRKALYEETWSFATFVSFFGRWTIAMGGFWMLVAVTPLLADQAGAYRVLASLGLGAVMLAWGSSSSTIYRALLRVRPITDRALLDRFAPLVAAAGLPAPRFEYIPTNGGVVANAFALAAPAGSSVVFTETLLSRFTADETVAICAHELAHLEDFARGRLRRSRRIMFGFAAAATALAPFTRWL